jgi:hypothetical protein
MKNWAENYISSMRFALRIDEVFRPIFHTKRDQEKNYMLHFLNQGDNYIEMKACSCMGMSIHGQEWPMKSTIIGPPGTMMIPQHYVQYISNEHVKKSVALCRNGLA